MSSGDKRTITGELAILAAEAERVEQQVGRVVEQHRVIGEVQMAVEVDPLGQDLAAIAVERCREAHRQSPPSRWRRAVGKVGVRIAVPGAMVERLRSIASASIIVTASI